MNYRIGLDIGTTSVGWAVIKNNENGDAIKIIDLGSRVFVSAEAQKNGESLALPRRMARSVRRRLRRRRHRIDRIINLLNTFNLISEEEIKKEYKKQNLDNIYKLKVFGLDNKLSMPELARILIHYSKKRGYKSNSKAEQSNDESSGKMLTATSENRKIMIKNKYRTISEMYLNDSKFKKNMEINGENIEYYSTKNTKEDYKCTIFRDDLEQEIKLVLQKQKELNPKISSEFIEEYMNIWSSQRNFDDGPGGREKGSLIKNMFGKCTFEDEPRAPKASYTFEYFKLLQDLNHIRLIGKTNNRTLSKNEREILIQKFLIKDQLSFTDIRILLNIDNDEIFNLVKYKKEISLKENEDKQKLTEFKSYHILRKAFNNIEKNYILNIEKEKLNKISYILTAYKSDDNRRQAFKDILLDKKEIETLLTLSFAKVGNLSITAMKKIIPFLEKGITYDKACSEVYKDFRGIKTLNKKNKVSINDLEEMSNPVVKRAVSQTTKVINAIVRKYGEPDLIIIELARELSKNFAERKKIEKFQQNNMEKNEKAKEQILEYKKNGMVTGEDIVKFNLWQEQQGVCAYSKKVIPLEELFGLGNYDIDHIIPYSWCFDDSYKNKVLVTSEENRQKSNRLPIQYLKNIGRNVEEYKIFITNIIKDTNKLRRILKEDISDEEIKELKSRSLNDTKYINTVVYNLLINHLNFKESKYLKKPVRVVSGRITSHVRARLGINKIREEGDTHHAIDAAIIANISESMIKKITNFYQYMEYRFSNRKDWIDRETGEVYNREEYILKFGERFPEPWNSFRKELEARIIKNKELLQKSILSLKLKTYTTDEIYKLSPIFVSRMPNRKITGEAHASTLRSVNKSGNLVKKELITKLKLDSNNEIENYDYESKISDKLLYNALKDKLIKFNGSAEEAFKDNMYKPTKSGLQGPIVKTVRLEKKSTLNVELGNKTVAENGSMIRIDVFHIENDGYYAIPIYVSDTVKKELPNKAIVAGKPHLEWKIMDNDNFIFSLYPGDLVYIKEKNGTKLVTNEKIKEKREFIVEDAYLYYRKASISTGSIDLDSHDRNYVVINKGIKKLQCFEKYIVDPLGKIEKVKLPEKRMPFYKKV